VGHGCSPLAVPGETELRLAERRGATAVPGAAAQSRRGYAWVRAPILVCPAGPERAQRVSLRAPPPTPRATKRAPAQRNGKPRPTPGAGATYALRRRAGWRDAWRHRAQRCRGLASPHAAHGRPETIRAPDVHGLMLKCPQVTNWLEVPPRLEYRRSSEIP
jgi:hypothetical protein